MSKLSFSLLSSGSRGNALYFTDGSVRILIDCGINARELTRRLSLLDVKPETLDAILLTHEHGDHVSGLPVFGKKVKCPVYANRRTMGAASRFLGELPRQIFVTGEQFSFGALVIEPFAVVHDAAEPVGFRISNGDAAVAIATDLGSVTDSVMEKVTGVDALVLETNHDPDLLWEAPYPWPLKQRIFGPDGHLSNNAAGQVVEQVSSASSCRLRVLVGAHVSEKSNHPELAEEALVSAWKGEVRPTVAVACANKPTELFAVG